MSYKKHGGLHFVKIGRVNLTFSRGHSVVNPEDSLSNGIIALVALFAILAQ